MSALRKYRREAKVSQADLAGALGVSQGTISKIERGVALPSLNLAVGIEQFTRGTVPANSWVDDASDTDAQRASAA